LIETFQKRLILLKIRRIKIEDRYEKEDEMKKKEKMELGRIIIMK